MKEIKFDLLSTVEYGGCSAKLSPELLSGLLNDIPLIKDNRIMVDIDTHDDAGVFRLNDDTALIVTTDFFPPVCSDAFTFGEIAAANSLSDVYAMGGTPLLTLNLTMFPSSRIPVDILKDILLGGQDMINKSGAFTMGGHTIDDYPPKYGLAVVGIVHPDKLITNSGVKTGQKLILTKPLGTGVLIAAHRVGICDDASYEEALKQMKILNKKGMELMQKYGVRGATDITGFGLAGHAMRMAKESGVSIRIDVSSVPQLPQVSDMLELGCIPGGAFRNLKYVEDNVVFASTVSTELKMLMCDPQTSGGLFLAVDADKADYMIEEFKNNLIEAFIIGEAIQERENRIYFY